MSDKTPNPKDAIGVKKGPLSVLPWPVIYEVGLAMLEGALKYGRHNFRVAPVRASVYFDGAMRHETRWWEGEDNDPEIVGGAKVHHLSKAIACLVILRDAALHGKLIDDRPPSSPEFMSSINRAAKTMIEATPEPLPAFTREGYLAMQLDKGPPFALDSNEALLRREQASAALDLYVELRNSDLYGRRDGRTSAARDVLLNMAAGVFPEPFEDIGPEYNTEAVNDLPAADDSHDAAELPKETAPVKIVRTASIEELMQDLHSTEQFGPGFTDRNGRIVAIGDPVRFTFPTTGITPTSSWVDGGEVYTIVDILQDGDAEIRDVGGAGRTVKWRDLVKAMPEKSVY